MPLMKLASRIRKSAQSILLLGLIRLTNCEAMNILGKLGVTPEQIRKQIDRVLRETQQPESKASLASRTSSRRRKSEKKDEEKTPLVDQLATDLTAPGGKKVSWTL